MSLVQELRRRSVFKVGAAYVVVAWLAAQAAALAFPTFEAPAWALRVFIFVLMLGFPIALVLAWTLEVTPEGVKVDAGGAGTKRVVVASLVLVALALAWFYRGQPTYKQEVPQAHAGPPSVAVLPFANLSGDPSQEYFSDGMTEELLNVLAQAQGLEVAARTSVFQFKNKGGDVRQIGKQLGVQYIIEGSVRRDGQELRITAQMIRVADGFHVWSETWDRKLEGVFALQEDIARRIAEHLKGSLAPDALPAARGAIDPEAYDEYLKGRELYRKREQLLDAIAHLRRAVEKAPNFAAAWASLSLAYEVADWSLDQVERELTKDKAGLMKEAAERARALAPDAATTLHALANTARADGRYLEAEQLYERAMTADPTYADVREDYSELLYSVGRFADSLAAARAGIAIDRDYLTLWWRCLDAAEALGRRDDFEAAATRLRELTRGRGADVAAIEDYDFDRGEYAKGIRHIEAEYARDPSTYAWMLGMMRWSQRDPEISPDVGARAAFEFPYLSMYAGIRGDDDLFFRTLTGNFVAWRYSLYGQMARPAVSRYLADPRAKKLLRDNGFEAYWRVKGWPTLCHPLGEHDFQCGPATPSAR